MRTLLINTPYPASEMLQIPMGLAYVAALLEREGIEVRVQDFLVEKYDKKKLAREIADFSPQIVGATSVTMNYPIALQILKDCKEINASTITVIGGPHVSFTVEETLKEGPWIDIVVRGEGECTMLELASGQKPDDINGIGFRKDGACYLTPPRRLIKDLDSLPPPARYLFPIPRYLAISEKTGLSTSRGCPFDCIFCLGHRMTGRKVRLRHPKLIVDEIEETLGQGFRGINIVDDLFTLNHRHVLAICDEMESRHLKFQWTAFARVDTVSRELLLRMKEVGCDFLCYGVESADQGILDTIKKKTTPQHIRQAVSLAKEAGIGGLASFILGLPGETAETLQHTLSFARELDTPCAFHLLAPFPGTELRNRAEQLGLRILTNDWLRYSANEAITETAGVTARMLNEAVYEYYDSVLPKPR